MIAVRVVPAPLLGQAARAQEQLIESSSSLRAARRFGLRGRRRRWRACGCRLGVRRGCQPEERRRDDKTGDRSPHLAGPPPQRRQGHEKASHQERQAEGERALVSLAPPVRPLACEASALHAFDHGGQSAQARVGGGEAEHPAPRSVGDRLERRGVQARDHRRPRGVALVSRRPTLGIEVGHRLPRLGADPHRVHDDAGLLRGLHRLIDLALEVLPVGDEHEDLVSTLLVDEGLEPLGKAHAQRRAGSGNDAGFDGLEEEPHGVGIQGEGRQGIGLPLEGHEGETVPLEAHHELEERLTGQEEPVRRDVRRGHRARRVEHENHVHALPLDLLAHDPPLRPGQRHDHSRRSQQQQRQPDPAPAFVGPADDAAPEGACHEACEPIAVAAGEPDLGIGDERQGEERKQPPRRIENHVRLLMPAPPSGPRSRRGPRQRGAPRQRAAPAERGPDTGGRPGARSPTSRARRSSRRSVGAIRGRSHGRTRRPSSRRSPRAAPR